MSNLTVRPLHTFKSTVLQWGNPITPSTYRDGEKEKKTDRRQSEVESQRKNQWQYNWGGTKLDSAAPFSPLLFFHEVTKIHKSLFISHVPTTLTWNSFSSVSFLNTPRRNMQYVQCQCGRWVQESHSLREKAEPSRLQSENLYRVCMWWPVRNRLFILSVMVLLNTSNCSFKCSEMFPFNTTLFQSIFFHCMLPSDASTTNNSSNCFRCWCCHFVFVFPHLQLCLNCSAGHLHSGDTQSVPTPTKLTFLAVCWADGDTVFVCVCTCKACMCVFDRWTKCPGSSKALRALVVVLCQKQRTLNLNWIEKTVRKDKWREKGHFPSNLCLGPWTHCGDNV